MRYPKISNMHFPKNRPPHYFALDNGGPVEKYRDLHASVPFIACFWRELAPANVHSSSSSVVDCSAPGCRDTRLPSKIMEELCLEVCAQKNPRNIMEIINEYGDRMGQQIRRFQLQHHGKAIFSTWGLGEHHFEPSLGKSWHWTARCCREPSTKGCKTAGVFLMPRKMQSPGSWGG